MGEMGGETVSMLDLNKIAEVPIITGLDDRTICRGEYFSPTFGLHVHSGMKTFFTVNRILSVAKRRAYWAGKRTS